MQASSKSSTWCFIIISIASFSVLNCFSKFLRSFVYYEYDILIYEDYKTSGRLYQEFSAKDNTKISVGATSVPHYYRFIYHKSGFTVMLRNDIMIASLLGTTIGTILTRCILVVTEID